MDDHTIATLHVRLRLLQPRPIELAVEQEEQLWLI